MSKISMLILGLIAEKPLNPYEIMKLMERMNLSQVFPMASSSIYATIKSLVKKGLISGRKVSSGNFPAKTVYSVTAAGEESLKGAVRENLENLRISYNGFDVSLSLICHLPREEALACLEKRAVEAEKQLSDLRSRYQELRKEGALPYTGLIRRRYGILKLEAELKIVKEMIRNIKKDRSWDHFPALDLEI